MGLLNKLLGNASEVSSEKLNQKYGRLLTDHEQIELGFTLFRDVFMFTNKRLILEDIQGLTGSKIEYKSLPYKNRKETIENPTLYMSLFKFKVTRNLIAFEDYCKTYQIDLYCDNFIENPALNTFDDKTKVKQELINYFEPLKDDLLTYQYGY